MTDDPKPCPLDRLVPAVAGYATDWFQLADDLDRLERVRRVGALEAVVLYCARVLESLAADAVATVDLQPSPNVFANLDTLECLNLIPTATRYWAHALRRLGNQVRHIRCRVAAEDVELGVLFLERWLDWFFRGFRYGLRLEALTLDAMPLSLSAHAESGKLLQLLETDEADLAAVAERMDPKLGGELPITPTLPAVLAERLMDRGEHKVAEALLEAALKRFPDDFRLRQLQGLYFSRTGRLQEAVAWLKPLYDQHRDDDETAGIMAGIYKRAWFENPAELEWLESSHRAYRQAWERSRRLNGYLGINAAATSLWLGRPAESRTMAHAVRELLLRQTGALAKFSNDPDLTFNFWQQMIVTEADLLLGNLGAARVRFRQTVDRYRDRQNSNIQVARKQFDAILQALGLTSGALELLATSVAAQEPAPVEESCALVIGVTGHRCLPHYDELHSIVKGALERVVRAKLVRQRSPAVILSALAEGADRMVAEIVLSPAFDGRLHVVLPLEVADYSTDFTSKGSCQEFQSLLIRAESIQFPDSQPNQKGLRQRPVGRSQSAETSADDQRNAAYLWAGRLVVDRCHVLIAVWDGRPAAGVGGTAQIVAYARQIGRPLVWINSIPPHAVQPERIHLNEADDVIETSSNQ
jgi:tetratricopeptide (TPR) repeat protein